MTDSKAEPLRANDNVHMRLKKESFRSNTNRYLAAFKDLFEGVASIKIWWGLAWSEFVHTYKRSYIGIGWAILSFIIFAVAVLFLVASIRQGMAGEMALYVLFGFLSFQFISTLINDGAKIFVSSHTWLKSRRIPKSLFVFKGISKAFIIFVCNAIGGAIILLYYGYRPGIGALWAIPGIMFCMFTAVFAYLLMGTIVARYRDVAFAIEAIMRMSFFVTPIIWVPPEEGLRAKIALYNPLTHYVAIIREPLLHGAPPEAAWTYAGATTLVIVIMGYLVFARYARRIVLWL